MGGSVLHFKKVAEQSAKHPKTMYLTPTWPAINIPRRM